MIDFDFSYFHAITPMFPNRYFLNCEDARRLRLEYILRTGFLVSGRELCITLPSSFSLQYFSSNSSIYLAQTITTKLPSVGGSHFHGEFSAFTEHIQGNPALIFHSSVTDDFIVYDKRHSLSEEVCIEESIPLNYAVALVLPCETPMSILIRIQKYFIDASLHKYDSIDKKKYRYELQRILKNPKRAVLSSYEEVLKYQKLLEQYQANIPCITYNNYLYNCEEELNNVPYILNRAQSFYEELEKK